MDVLAAAPGMYLRDEDDRYHLVVAWIVGLSDDEVGTPVLDPITVTEINTGAAVSGIVTSLVPKGAAVAR